MTNPWVISKIVHLLTPGRDIDPHGPKHDAPFFDTLIGNCITRSTRSLPRSCATGKATQFGGKVVERERFLKRMIRRMVCSPRNHCRGTLEGFESRIERTSGRMTASVTRQNKDSQRTRLLELRERVQTNDSDCAVNTAQGVETSGRPPGNAATSPPRAKTLE